MEIFDSFLICRFKDPASMTEGHVRERRRQVLIMTRQYPREEKKNEAGKSANKIIEHKNDIPGG